MAELVILSGISNEKFCCNGRKKSVQRKANLSGVVQMPHYSFRPAETMDGFLRDLQRVAEGAVKVVSAPFKAAGHTVMEAGRGISRGDISRVFLSPIKGVGHYAGETYRGGSQTIKASGTLLYDQSCNIAGISAAGTQVPGPQQPFVGATAAISGITCGVKTGIEGKRAQEKYNQDMEKYYQDLANQVAGQKPTQGKNNNALYLTLAAVALAAGVYTLT